MQFWRSEERGRSHGVKLKYWQEFIPSRSSKREHPSFSSLPSRGCSHAYFVDSSSMYKVITPFSAVKDLCDCIRSTWITQETCAISTSAENNHNSTCKLNSPLPHSLPHSQGPGIRTWPSLGPMQIERKGLGFFPQPSSPGFSSVLSS